MKDGPSRGRLVITGVDGFVGRHTAARAQRAGWSVIGVSRAAHPDSALLDVIDHYYSADLRVEWPAAIRADAVIHLAGLAAVGPSFADPQLYIASNSAMVTMMCEALLNWDRPVRVVGVSTGAVYGHLTEPAVGFGVDEGHRTSASSPYVVSKLLVESQFEYYAARGIDCVIARPFNHVGPGQSRGFIVPDLVHALATRGPKAPLATGDLSTERDYTDVRDVVDAYLLLAAAPGHDHSVYNVASGVSRSGREVLETVAAALGTATPPTCVDAARVRANDPQRIVGSAARLATEFGWSPGVSFPQSIEDAITGTTIAA